MLAQAQARASTRRMRFDERGAIAELLNAIIHERVSAEARKIYILFVLYCICRVMLACFVYLRMLCPRVQRCNKPENLHTHNPSTSQHASKRRADFKSSALLAVPAGHCIRLRAPPCAVAVSPSSTLNSRSCEYYIIAFKHLLLAYLW